MTYRSRGDLWYEYIFICWTKVIACKQYYNTKCVRLPDLLINLEIAKSDGNYKKVMAKYASPLADAIIDRIAHGSYCINIKSIDAEHDISMREVYGLDKTLRE